jgi:hypothetical protein
MMSIRNSLSGARETSDKNSKNEKKNTHSVENWHDGRLERRKKRINGKKACN